MSTGTEVHAMQISTTRFGGLRIGENDMIFFPFGLIGLESHHHWVLLADGNNDSVGWLQREPLWRLSAPGDLCLIIVSAWPIASY
jgi:hypothetical protein